MYLSAAVAFIVCDVMVWLFLPSMRKMLPLRSGFTGMGHWPTAGLCLSDGFQLYGNVSERSGSVYCLRCDGVAVFTVDAKNASAALRFHWHGSLAHRWLMP